MENELVPVNKSIVVADNTISFNETIDKKLEIIRPIYEEEASVFEEACLAVIENEVRIPDNESRFDALYEMDTPWGNRIIQKGHEILLQNGILDYTIDELSEAFIEYLGRDETEKAHETIINAFGTFYQIEEEVSDFAEEKAQTRENGKEDRSHWEVTHASSVKGAISGEVKAGILNLGNDLLWSIMDNAAEASDKKEIDKLKRSQYSEARAAYMLIWKSFCRVFGDFLYDFISKEKDYPSILVLEDKKYNARLANIDKMAKTETVPNEQLIKMICQLIVDSPFEQSHLQYLYVLDKEKKYTNEIFSLAEYLGLSGSIKRQIIRNDPKNSPEYNDLVKRSRENLKNGKYEVAGNLYKKLFFYDVSDNENLYYMQFCSYMTMRSVNSSSIKRVESLAENGIGGFKSKNEISRFHDSYLAAASKMASDVSNAYAGNNNGENWETIKEVYNTLYYKFGDFIANEHPELIGTFAVDCWKEGVKFHKKYLNNFKYPNPNIDIINTYTQKILNNCSVTPEEHIVILPKIQENTAQTSGNESSGGCYVATAVYGSYDCPEVWTLRRYRDNTLAETPYGRAFIHVYYAISPTLVKWFGHTDWFKKMWKGPLDKMVANLRASGVENTPYNDKDWH